MRHHLQPLFPPFLLALGFGMRQGRGYEGVGTYRLLRQKDVRLKPPLMPIDRRVDGAQTEKTEVADWKKGRAVKTEGD